jgi:hypothetical protein
MNRELVPAESPSEAAYNILLKQNAKDFAVVL